MRERGKGEREREWGGRGGWEGERARGGWGEGERQYLCSECIDGQVVLRPRKKSVREDIYRRYIYIEDTEYIYIYI